MPLHLQPDAVAVAAQVPADADAVARLVGPDSTTSPPAPFAAALLATQGFEGEPGQVAVALDGETVRMLVGTGREPGPAELRRAGGAAVRAALKVGHVAIEVDEAAVDDVVQGALLGSYRFTALKGLPAEAPPLARLTVVAAGGSAPRPSAVAAAVALARDLVNAPGGTLTATAFADRITEVGASAGLEVEVWDRDRIVEERMGGVLAVNAGSTEPPRVVVLRYRPAESTGSLALVGKGITFDSGGLSLKPPDSMEWMKSDMGGAAAVVGAMSALAATGATKSVTGIVLLTDNMPSGSAQRPGDVFTARNGKTVEVLNTDAEGRLVLADGLSLAVEMAPDAIVDAATLTGACMVALGRSVAGLMGDDAVVARLESAASEAGEQVWKLPLPEEYRKQLDSPVADLRNIGTARYGGALLAGLFLREFTGDVPWAHVDLAGPAWTEEPDAADRSKGGTGFGVRTFLALAR